jgi:hypothetical protein
MKNEEAWLAVKERNILRIIKPRITGLVIQAWEMPSKPPTEGKQNRWGRQGRRSKQLLSGLKKKTVMDLKEEALDCTLWELASEKAVDLL